MLDQHVPRVSRTAAGAAAVAARCVADAEGSRRLAPDVVGALIDAGFARHFVPAVFGGTQGGFAELTGSVATVGEACAASAWCASLLAYLPRFAAYLPLDGQREIWAGGPDAVVVGSPSPFGTARAVSGGWRLSGSWPYVSGVDYADWSLVCATVPDAAPRIFALPRRDYTVAESWFNVGMQATGSNTVVVDDAFVPGARSFPREELFDGKAVAAEGDCHQVPLHTVNGLSFAAPILGAARGALAAWTGYIAGKLARSRPGAPGPSRTSFDMALAQASGEIDSAALLLDRAGAVADARAALTPELTARNLRDCAIAVRTLVHAVDLLFDLAGTSGQSTSSPVQRFWRDVHSAASHVALQFEPAANAYAATVFGDEEARP
ncbi:hydrolase [Actinomadura decatromicini]|uniref:Hydrolase n=1 Tax=Actinomadura decatromicini TaxID=2604572 RepID=A0A5D3F850_9ACTN|nr:hydrolase [Actinomadura decatromicini]TYK44084.1 hydrolase [Actinomadura decatromicini]